jgi:ABC-2 type transport system ATP-binding protein
MTTATTATTTASALTVTGLRKSFGDNLVLDGLDLEVTEGTVFSLLGPNGAGKTTTVQILSTRRDRRDRPVLSRW